MSLLTSEIAEQPAVLARLLDAQLPRLDALAHGPAPRRDRRGRGGRARQLRQRGEVRAVPLVAADRPVRRPGDAEPPHRVRRPDRRPRQGGGRAVAVGSLARRGGRAGRRARPGGPGRRDHQRPGLTAGPGGDRRAGPGGRCRAFGGGDQDLHGVGARGRGAGRGPGRPGRRGRAAGRAGGGTRGRRRRDRRDREASTRPPRCSPRRCAASWSAAASTWARRSRRPSS